MGILNEDIPVTIEYRKVKNINLYIKPPDGRILVTAPGGVSKKTIYQFLESKAAWIERARQRVDNVHNLKNLKAGIVSTQENVDKMLKKVEKYVDKWEPVMGVHAAHWTIREMKTRWGSCTVGTGRIRLNTRLAVYPDECLEYVIVHELCHLLEPSHNQRFKALMSQFLPDWKERKMKLGTG